ncbi:SAM-dependent methyltransferase [Paenibacillus sp. UMB4589-SE434]|uniref:SAM-dependent methyltransferase n=1 Tax=Paenibacillus sp. UMB4589-SE434 TaxID=3046314 RepID=UPI00254A77A5|nr:SAM-dependent methyltransferase [Paenibacillus sp. UMB4589-SE434]MDK8180384.1 SAM-dependent methyltransferase [Paenibacillus sp. UMB4589-SE434]
MSEINMQEIQLPVNYEGSSHWIITSNHGYIPYAQEELRRRYAELKSQIFVSGEVALMELPRAVQDIWQDMNAEPVIFVRDMFPVQVVVEAVELTTAEQAEQILVIMQERSGIAFKSMDAVSIHLRRSGKGADEAEQRSLKSFIKDALERHGAQVVLQQPQYIVSIFEHQGNIYAGLATLSNQGSDWPGGAIRFQREVGQISRAKFKLLEAERTLGLDLSAYQHALDIGAAPGGWTSLLLERGLTVTAVDPANMHPSLIDHPQLSIIKGNAGEVAFEPHEFDLLVCDMSWSPKHTAQLVIQLLEAVMPGGTVIVTVKLMHKKPLQTIRDCMEMFAEHLQIVRAKQLFHNRDEITLYMMKY